MSAAGVGPAWPVSEQARQMTPSLFRRPEAWHPPRSRPSVLGAAGRFHLRQVTRTERPARRPGACLLGRSRTPATRIGLASTDVSGETGYRVKRSPKSTSEWAALW
jgi:hypothetical protein